MVTLQSKNLSHANGETKKRGTKEKMLRYMLRKKQCFYTTIMEIITFLILSITFLIIVVLYLHFKKTSRDLTSEDIMIKNMSNIVTFAHCQYDLTNLTFNTEYCGKRLLDENYAYRILRLKDGKRNYTKNEKIFCLDIYQKVKCHDNSTNIHTFDYPYGRENYKSDKNKYFQFVIQCPGAMYSRMLLSFNGTAKYAPLVTNQQLEGLKGKVIQAQDLIARCPKCSIRTRQFKFQPRGKCYIKQHTDEKGWPALFEECNDVTNILHASTNCDEVVKSTSASLLD